MKIFKHESENGRTLPNSETFLCPKPCTDSQHLAGQTKMSTLTRSPSGRPPSPSASGLQRWDGPTVGMGEPPLSRATRVEKDFIGYQFFVSFTLKLNTREIGPNEPEPRKAPPKALTLSRLKIYSGSCWSSWLFYAHKQCNSHVKATSYSLDPR